MAVITTYYLEMLDPNDLRKKSCSIDVEVKECTLKQYSFNRFLYHLVGEQWQWIDKQVWTDQDWSSYVADENLHTWVCYLGGSPVGYYELQSQEAGQVEIAYFGVIPTFIGAGIGGYLLSHALQSAWSLPGTRRVWVHTCSLDHPNALNNYQARGMKIYDKKRTEQSDKIQP